MPIISIPQILREKLTDEGVEALIALLNQTEEKAKEVIVSFSEEKYERRLVECISRLRVEIAEEFAKVRKEFTEEFDKVRKEFTGEIANLRKEFTEEIANLKKEFTEQIANLRKEFTQEFANVRRETAQQITTVRKEFVEQIAKTYANLIRWMFIFWVGQAAVFTSILFAFFKR